MTTRTVDRGDGPPCPEPGEHGRLYFIVNGLRQEAPEYLWCPVTQELFAVADGGHGVGKALRVRVEDAPPIAKMQMAAVNVERNAYAIAEKLGIDLDAIDLEDFE